MYILYIYNIIEYVFLKLKTFVPPTPPKRNTTQDSPRRGARDSPRRGACEDKISNQAVPFKPPITGDTLW